MEETATSPVAPGDVVGGKYRVERVLGVGGMGVVVAARHDVLGQMVALKFILPELAARAEVTQRFLREGRAVVQLQSEHVARVSDVGVETIAGKPTPCLVMEYLEGVDLFTLQAEKERRSILVADAVSYLVQACDALAEAHVLGIVHRDLKPENLFLARRLGRPPIIKVLDFGGIAPPNGQI